MNYDASFFYIFMINRLALIKSMKISKPFPATCLMAHVAINAILSRIIAYL